FCQIGDDSRCQVGNAIASSPVTRPQGVLYGRGLPGIGPFLVDVVQVAAGESHTCALLNGPAFPSNGNVTCWGTGDEGELGNPGTTFDAIPGAVVDSSGATSSRLSGVREIAAGLHHTCALMNGGTVQCWGSNSNGQLGRPGANSFPPVTVIDANAVTAPSG